MTMILVPIFQIFLLIMTAAGQMCGIGWDVMEGEDNFHYVVVGNVNTTGQCDFSENATKSKDFYILETTTYSDYASTTFIACGSSSDYPVITDLTKQWRSSCWPNSDDLSLCNDTGTHPFDHFVLIDSIWMTQTTARELDDLLDKVKDIWTIILGIDFNATLLVLRKIETNFTDELHSDSRPEHVAYYIGGQNSSIVSLDDARLKFRQVLEQNPVDGLLGTPLHWPNTFAKRSEIPNQQNCGVFNYSIVAAFSSAGEKSDAVRFIRRLWGIILELPSSSVNFTVIDDVVLHAEAIPNKHQLHRLTFEISLLDNIPSAQEAKLKFNKLLDETSQTYHVYLLDFWPNGSVASSIGASENPTDVSVFDFVEMPSNETVSENVTNISDGIVLEKVSVLNFTMDRFDECLQTIFKAWKAALGGNVTDLILSVSEIAEVDAFSHNVSYAIVYTPINGSILPLAIEDIRHSYRHILKKMTNNSFAEYRPVNISSNSLERQKSDLKVFVLFDTVYLAFGSDKIPDSICDIFRQIWTQTLGENARAVTFTVYRIGTEQSFSLAGDNGLPIARLYFSVKFSSVLDTWNVKNLKLRFRQLLTSARNSTFLVSPTDISDVDLTTTTASSNDLHITTTTTVIAPIVSTSPLADSAIIQDTLLLSYPNETERNRYLSLLREAWAAVLVRDVFDVRLTLSQERLLNSSSSSNQSIPLHEITYIVIPPNSKNLDFSALKSALHERLLNTTWYEENTNQSIPHEYDTDLDRFLGCNGTAFAPQKWTTFTENGTEDWFYQMIPQSMRIKATDNLTTVDVEKGIEELKSTWKNATDDYFGSSLHDLSLFMTDQNANHSDYVVLDYVAILLYQDQTAEIFGLVTDLFRNLSNESSLVIDYEPSSVDRHSCYSVTVGTLIAVREATLSETDLQTSLSSIWNRLSSEDRLLIGSDYMPNFPNANSTDSTTTTLTYVQLWKRNTSSISASDEKLGRNYAEIIQQQAYSLNILNDTIWFAEEKSAPNSNLEFADSIALQFDSLSQLNLSLAEIRRLWALAFRTDISNIDLQSINQQFVTNTIGGNISQIHYRITVGDFNSTTNTENVKNEFRNLLNGNHVIFVPNADQLTTRLVTLTRNISENETDSIHTTPKPQMPGFYQHIIFDQLRLRYFNENERDEAMEAFAEIWKNASEASFAKIVIYQEFPPADENISPARFHTIFYVVLILTNTSTIDEPNIKQDFRDKIFDADLPFVVNFAEVFPAPQPETVQAYAFIGDFSSNAEYSRKTDKLKTGLKRLYESALGFDALQVQVWTLDENPSNSSSNSSALLQSVVLVITNNTEFDRARIAQKYQTLLLDTSLTSILEESDTIDNPSSKSASASKNDSSAAVSFRQTVCVDPAEMPVETLINQLEAVWKVTLDPLIVNVTVSVLESDLSQEPTSAAASNSTCSSYTFAIHGSLSKAILDIDSVQKKVYDQLSSLCQTATSSTTRLISSTAIPALFP